jgi:hypothetical protein
LLNASYSLDGVFEKINNIILVGRASQYAGSKCPEAA